MIDDDVSDQIIEDVPAIEETKVLLGLMSEIQAKEWMKLDYSVRNRWGPQLDDSEKEQILEEEWDDFEEIYTNAAKGLEAPPDFNDSQIKLRDLPDDDEIQEYVEEFKSSTYFQDVYGEVPQEYWSIKLIPIESLVAFQSSVSIEAHQEIPTTEDGWLDVLQYCLPKDVKNYLMVDDRYVPDRSASVRFVSRNPNVNFDEPTIETIDDRPPGNLSVTFNVKARPNFIQVAHYGDRYILKNGYHRSYQLLEAGESHIPAVILDVSRFETTGAGTGGWKRERIMGPRPPLVWDFTTDVAVNLETKGKNKMIKFDAEKFDINR